MLRFNINLTSLAVILWSGMLIISGSIWVLSSQVRRLAELFDAPTKPATNPTRVVARGSSRAALEPSRAASRRGVSSRVLRASVSVARVQAAYPALPAARQAALPLASERAPDRPVM